MSMSRFFLLFWVIVGFGCAQQQVQKEETRAPTARVKPVSTARVVPVSDGQIESNAVTLIALAGVSPLDVEISSENGTLSFAGLVPDPNVKARLLKAAANLKGVKSVTDNLQIAEEAALIEESSTTWWSTLLSFLAIPLLLALLVLGGLILFFRMRLPRAKKAKEIPFRNTKFGRDRSKAS